MYLSIRFLLPAALLSFLVRPLYAQRTLNGTIQDQQGTAIPFAIVELPSQKLGVQADQAGQFSLPLPAGIVADSLTISALGYQKNRIAVPALATCQVQLSALPVALSEVVIHASATPAQWLGPAEDVERFGFSQNGLSAEKNSGWQIARYFPAVGLGYLTGGRFFVKPSGIGRCDKVMLQAPFRVRVYAADGPDGSPGTDLLTQTILAAATKSGWVHVDLSAYNITFPTQGLYVAMEWVYTSDKFLCTYQYSAAGASEKKTGTRYGQILGGRAATDTQTWHLILGQGWRRFQARNAAGKSIVGDAAIQAGFQPQCCKALIQKAR
jgi:hypothetical protein